MATIERKVLILVLVIAMLSGMNVEAVGSQEAPDEDGQQPGNVLPGTDTCGLLFSDRIVGGGTYTRIGEFPWVVLLRYKKQSSETYSFYCGGSLINSRYVLTAAQCLASDHLNKSEIFLDSVRLGEYDTRTDPDCYSQGIGKRVCAPNHIDIEVEKAFPHEQYVPNSVDQRNDIALLRLKRSVSFTDYVRPICLPTSEELRRNLFVGYTMDVAGWGLTEDLLPSPIKQKISVGVWNQTECQDKYKSKFQVHLNNADVCRRRVQG
ncbi:hypothetical protein KR059_004580 [Drosophila kikkawai]|nr:hypothetical protein KR059_004580 [Drosophila kikkawai]